jgi:hypothetical protein
MIGIVAGPESGVFAVVAALVVAGFAAWWWDRRQRLAHSARRPAGGAAVLDPLLMMKEVVNQEDSTEKVDHQVAEAKPPPAAATPVLRQSPSGKRALAPQMRLAAEVNALLSGAARGGGAIVAAALVDDDDMRCLRVELQIPDGCDLARDLLEGGCPEVPDDVIALAAERNFPPPCREPRRGCVTVAIRAPENYPWSPPAVRIEWPRLRGNHVSSTGAICADVLGVRFSPAFQLESLLVSLLPILSGEGLQVARDESWKGPTTFAESEDMFRQLMDSHGW